MDKIQASIDKTFVNDTSSLQDFYQGVLGNYKETIKDLKKCKGRLVLICIVYFILHHTSIDGIDIGPFKITNIDIIIKIFPLIISYQFYEFSGLQSFTKALHLSLNSCLSRLYPKIFENNLEFLMKPESNINTEDFFVYRNQSARSTKAVSGFQILIQIFTIFLLPTAILVYALCNSFLSFGSYDILVWVVLVIAVVFYIQSLLLFFELATYG